jgi:hypothetical protein
MAWKRKLWGIEFTGSMPGDRPAIIGRTWDKHIEPTYSGEPSRALLFTTRQLAREWCHAKLAQFRGRKDFVARWKFRPVRVIETVEKS